MTENTNAVPATPLALAPAANDKVVSLMAQLGVSDLSAITTVLFETRLEAAKSDLESQRNAVNKRINEAEQAINEDCDKQVKAHKDSDVSALVPMVKAAGFKAVKVEIEAKTVDEAKLKIDLTVAVVRVDGQTERYGYSNTLLSKDVTLPFTDKAKGLVKDVVDARKELTALNSQLAEVHKALSNMGRIERQARARMAAHALEQTAEGREILASLNSVGVKALPAAAQVIDDTIPGTRKARRVVSKS